MGLNLKDLVEWQPVDFKDLRGRKLAIDAFNILYQFLSAIRQSDGTPLKDSKGNITSHLTGLFYRTINLLEYGILPCFVFDGKHPDLKALVREKRYAIKSEAMKRYAEALERGMLEEAKKYAQQTSHLTPEMVSECKELLDALGLPWVQALADGEAQAAYMASRGDFYAIVSQDYDSLLFGAPILIRNLTVSKGTPEKLALKDVLKSLGLERQELVKLGILMGTDYNEGVKGVGPKTALKIVKEGKFDEYEIENGNTVLDIFLKPAVTDNYKVKWGSINERNLKEILCKRHDFSVERVDNAIKKLGAGKGQEKLASFF